MGNKLIWALLLSIILGLGIFFLAQPKVQQAGDIAEYFGITESILSHANVDLTSQDRLNLEKVLHPAYFIDPGYYILGTDEKRYPVHFVFYSILATPVRVILDLAHANPLNTLVLTNLLIFAVATASVMRFFALSGLQRGVLLLLLLLSPLAFFMAWPGPDLYYVMLLVAAVFLFYTKRYYLASVIAVLASWHSQPLFVLALGFLALYLYEAMKGKSNHGKHKFVLPFRALLMSSIPVFLLAIPYLYNFVAFGVLTPWTLLQNGWTQVYGFGLQNASLQRLFEMFFDLNMGLFWYSPVIFLSGCFYFFRSMLKDTRSLILAGFLILTAFFYQTNPAWHFGTAGYGPSRHVLFILPVLLYFLVKNVKASAGYFLLLVLIVVSQLFVLSLNGWFLPNWEKTLYQSPFASYVLKHYPALYNPTPEIFVDRTNHTDLSYITSAIYKDNGVCKKAYVLITEKDKLEKECGGVPEKYQEQFDNDFLRKASYPRSIWTIEAMFWPDTQSCEDSYIPTQAQTFHCMKTIQDVVKFTGVEDSSRFEEVARGVWKMSLGQPVKVTVPPGYILHHYSFDGVYINYD